MYKIRPKTIIFILSFFISKIYAETFNVLIPLIPEVNPIENQVNVGNYIGQHIYYPLFHLTNNGNIESHFLNIHLTKSLNLSFKDYIFCMKENIQNTDGEILNSDDLIASIKYFSENYPFIFQIKESSILNESCAKIQLTESRPNFFKTLTGIASTILKKNDIKKVYPPGYGPYKISSRSSETIKLIQSTHKKIRFQEIFFYSLNSQYDLKAIDDFNQIPTSLISTLNVNQYNKTSAKTLKTYAHVLNIKESSNRLCVALKLKNIPWGEIYKIKILKNYNFLPIIINNTSQNLTSEIKDKCEKPKVKIDFLIVDIFNSKEIIDSLKEKGLLDFLNPIVISASQLPIIAFSGKEYVALMGFDGTSTISSLESDYSTYFESFVSTKNRIISSVNFEILNILKKAANPKLTKEQKKLKYQEASNKLVSSGFISPLGILEKNFYFKKNINISKWADYYSGYPLIHEIN